MPAEQECAIPYAAWKRIDELQRELQAAQERELQTLVAFYYRDRRACAYYCDEVADPSGALLGRVRDAAERTGEPSE